jgi:hypothetical protein
MAGMALRKKALVGRLTEREFRSLRDRGRVVVAPLRALVKRIRSVRRFASSVPKVPPATLEALDAAIRSAGRGSRRRPPRDRCPLDERQAAELCAISRTV